MFTVLNIIILFSVLIIGGLGWENYYFLGSILLWLIINFFISVRQKKDFKFPPGVFLYQIFLIFFSFNLFWTKNFWSTLLYLMFYAIGFFFWIIAYNQKPKFKHLAGLVILLGVIFAIWSIVNILIGIEPKIDSFSLNKFATRDHHHIADLWAVVLSIIAVNLMTGSKNKIYWLLIPFGAYLFYISRSRTAILALLAGTFYIFQALPETKKYLKRLYILITAAILLFLFFGRTKPVLLDRVYYLQGIAGVIRNPLGVGVGNFGLISSDSKNHLFGLSDFSSVAMNLILEMLTGMGVFAFIFLVWFIKVIFTVFAHHDENSLVPKLIFLTLTVNFLFDFTYLIPTFLWLWFISLGLSQK
ncbi:hypothetical protein A2774_01850 [Candidatus Roizmanbacteria bacterium RIFCSPHIGHO2_01_FULL_39_12c]|uniref:O-antigen polymerase n=1 Tax=Candidatus Roizmanbacteria bacterium RIFCSPHIGHO2_01_FULL_39_12c TaxID=1802031 RepID=A0A1F7GB52_9BACT|nr:MAG: hypothetical protein A2774_01850 [Candidatus Roizmanbacteria bacterium RIFCSPHIGHO2_01_FULL_39_12c]OGK46936.1 MAG: hypothetical protein A2963_05260 [Candidatus Roizmanbacteria bacterium RIFCSPLOWO2_01_FULL_40_13]